MKNTDSDSLYSSGYSIASTPYCKCKVSATYKVHSTPCIVRRILTQLTYTYMRSAHSAAHEQNHNARYVDHDARMASPVMALLELEYDSSRGNVQMDCADRDLIDHAGQSYVFSVSITTSVVSHLIVWIRAAHCMHLYCDLQTKINFGLLDGRHHARPPSDDVADLACRAA